MFDRQGNRLGGNCFLHRDNMHADPSAAGRHHLGNPCQGEICHAFKEVGCLREHVSMFGMDHHNLRAAGDKHVQNPALFMIRILAVKVFPMVLDQSAFADGLEGLLQISIIKLRILRLDLCEGHRNALLHRQGNVQNIVRHLLVILDSGELQRGVDAFVFGRFRGNLLQSQHGGIIVGNFPCQFCDFFVFGHKCSPLKKRLFPACIG